MVISADLLCHNVCSQNVAKGLVDHYWWDLNFMQRSASHLDNFSSLETFLAVTTDPLMWEGYCWT